MAKTVYIGVGGAARKVKGIYVGVGGVARKVKKAFIGVGGVARQCYSSAPDDPAYTGSYDIVTNGNYRYMYLKTSGTLTVRSKGDYSFFLVGGGASGQGGSYVQDGGGGSGYTKTLASKSLSLGTVSVVIGAGGREQAFRVSPQGGGTSSVTISGVTTTAAGGSSTRAAGTPQYYGTDGGSGGAGGGGHGAAIVGGFDGASCIVWSGGAGQGTTTHAFGEANNTLYAGGGSSPGDYVGAPGSPGGGGAGIIGIGYADVTGGSGTANTGGGGGASAPGDSDCVGYGGAGGSGIIIVRWAT